MSLISKQSVMLPVLGPEKTIKVTSRMEHRDISEIGIAL